MCRPTGPGGRATVAVVLDVSASTAYARNDRTRLDAGRAAAADLLSALHHGDRAALVFTGTVDPAPVVAPTTDLQSVASKVADARPAAGEADVAAALTRAADVLDGSPGDRLVCLVCDRQAASWRNVTDAFGRAWAARRPPRVVVCPVGGLEADNLTVEDVRLATTPAVRGVPVAVDVRVRNAGPTARAGVPVAVWSGPQTFVRSTVSVPGRSTRTVHGSATFAAAGPTVVSATVASTGVTADDRLDTAVDVVDPVRVLILTGDAVVPGDDPAAVLRLALQPFATTGRRGADPAVVTVRPSSAWPAALGGYDVVVLANAPAPTPAQARDLDAFVYAGGGLLVAPGDLARADAYDAALYRDGAGLLPAKLSPPAPADVAAPTSVLGLEVRHPIFAFGADRPDPLPTARIARYFPATPRLPDAAVLATYATGQPFAVAAAAGRGRVLLVTTALDDRWTTLPRSTFFLPFVQSAARWLAAGTAVDRNVPLGRPWVEAVDGVVDDRSAAVVRPSGRRDPVTVTTTADGRSDLRYAHADVPGTYRLRYRAGGVERTVPFAVAPDPAESDLTPVADADWPSLLARVGGDRVDATREAIAAAVDRGRGGRDLWLPLLVAVGLLSAVELTLGRRWSTTAGRGKHLFDRQA